MADDTRRWRAINLTERRIVILTEAFQEVARHAKDIECRELTASYDKSLNELDAEYRSQLTSSVGTDEHARAEAWLNFERQLAQDGYSRKLSTIEETWTVQAKAIWGDLDQPTTGSPLGVFTECDDRKVSSFAMSTGGKSCVLECAHSSGITLVVKSEHVYWVAAATAYMDSVVQQYVPRLHSLRSWWWSSLWLPMAVVFGFSMSWAFLPDASGWALVTRTMVVGIVALALVALLSIFARWALPTLDFGHGRPPPKSLSEARLKRTRQVFALIVGLATIVSLILALD